MQALILAGGKGTRLRPLTVYTPKPIVPLMNRPFILHQIDILLRAGIKDIILSLSYQPDKIEQMIGDGSELGVSIRYVTEPSPMGTAGAFRFASEGLTGSTIVMNGDILTDIDIARLVEHHRSQEAEATLALVAVDDASAYGLVDLDEGNRVRGFLEKPGRGENSEPVSGTVNAGIYVFEPSVLDLIPAGENRSFENHVFPELVSSDRRVFGYPMEDSYWRDIGNPASYLRAHQDILAGRLAGISPGRSETADIATAAAVDKVSVIGPDCTIKPGARITASVLGPGVHVEEKAVIENSVVWGHTRVSTAAEIDNAVVGKSCHIGRNARVSAGAVLGDKTSLSDYTQA